MDLEALLETLRQVEALQAGATTRGEAAAAERARDRLLTRLRKSEEVDPPQEIRFSMRDMWSRKLFMALLRRYELEPYRYHRQRRTTVMVRMSRRFLDETLWPQFLEFSDRLQHYLSDVTDRIIAEVLTSDGSEANVVADPPALTDGE